MQSWDRIYILPTSLTYEPSQHQECVGSFRGSSTNRDSRCKYHGLMDGEGSVHEYILGSRVDVFVTVVFIINVII